MSNTCPEPCQRLDDSTDRKPVEYTERLAELLEEKLRLIEKVFELAISQSELCTQDELPVVMGLIARREMLMDRLQQVEEGLRTYQSDDPEARSWKSPERRQECQDIAARLSVLIQAVLQLDSQTLETMGQQRDMIASELRQGLDAQLSQQAYSSDWGEAAPSTIDISDL